MFVCVCSYESGGSHAMVHWLSVSPHLPTCLRQNLLLLTDEDQNPWSVTFLEASVLVFPRTALGLQMYSTPGL